MTSYIRQLLVAISHRPVNRLPTDAEGRDFRPRDACLELGQYSLTALQNGLVLDSGRLRCHGYGLT